MYDTFQEREESLAWLDRGGGPEEGELDVASTAWPNRAEGRSPAEEIEALLVGHTRSALQHDGAVAAELSGGIDSSIAYEMCTRAMRRNRTLGESPTSVTLVISDEERPAMKRAVASATRDAGERARFIELDRHWSLKDFPDCLDRYTEPSTALIHVAYDMAINEAAVAAGASTLISGDGADSVLFAPLTRAPLSLEAGRFARFVTDLYRFSKTRRGQPFWKLAIAHGLLHEFPEFIRICCGVNFSSRSWQTVGAMRETYETPRWMGPRLSRKLPRLFLRWRRGASTTRSIRGAARRYVLRGHVESCSAALALQQDVSDQYGISRCHPYRSGLLTDYIASLQPSQWYPLVRGKRILHIIARRAWGECVPRFVRSDFTDAHRSGIAREAPRVEHWMRHSALGEINYIDVDSFLTAFRAYVAGDNAEATQIYRVLALEAWMLRNRFA